MKCVFKSVGALFTMICIVFTFSSCGEKLQPYLIPENIEFGMQESEVITAMGKEPDYSSVYYITYEFPYEQYKLPAEAVEHYDVEYYFNRFGELDQIAYEIDDDGVMGTDFDVTIQMKDDILNYLKEIHGEPLEYTEEWSSTRYKFDEASWDKALKNGDLKINASWKLLNDEILLRMDFGGGRPLITYTHTEYASFAY